MTVSEKHLLAPFRKALVQCGHPVRTGYVSRSLQGNKKYKGFWAKGQKIREKTFINKGLCRGCAGKTFYAGQERADAKVGSEKTVRHAHEGLGLQGSSASQRCQAPDGSGKKPRNGVFPGVFESTFGLAGFQCVAGPAQSHWYV